MTTTFETSKRLKEAGFPQPANGSWWLMGRFYLDPMPDMIDVFVNTMPVTTAFAPTADQILAELPGTFRLGANVGERNGVKCVEYVAWDLTDDDLEMIAAYHENAAEALALAWLDWKNKKTRAKQGDPSGA